MRRFRQLTEGTIKEIYAGYLSDEPKLHIARRLQIDNSTVHYHIRKIRHIPREQLITLFRPTCSDGHTSFKCAVCGTAFDNIKSNEFHEIVRLRQLVADLQKRLHERVSVPSFRPSSGGVVHIIG